MQIETPLSEIAGLAVALLLALGLVSLMVWARGMSAGLPRRVIRHALLSVWVLVLALVAMLFGLRAVLGVGVLSGSPTEGIVAAESLPGWGWAVVVLAVAVVIVVAWWLRRILRPFTQPEASGVLPADESC